MQVVTNDPEVHGYAAQKPLTAVQSKQVHEVCISYGVPAGRNRFCYL